jgi:hypothetical protein
MTIGVNKAGADWLLLRAHLMGEIEAARSRLESNLLDQVGTSYERGVIAAYRQLLDQVEPDNRTPEHKDVNYG